MPPATPPIRKFRVIRLHVELPGDINLILPSPDSRTVVDPSSLHEGGTVTELDSTRTIRYQPPDMAPFYMCIGAFLDAWEILEGTLKEFLVFMLDTTPEISRAMAMPLSGKSLNDALRTFGEIRLTDEKLSELSALLSTFTSLTTTRNVIVHGAWIVENVFHKMKSGNVGMISRVYRESCSIPPLDNEKIYNYKNQKIRRKYLYTHARITRCMNDINSLHLSFSKFWSSLLA